MIETPRLKLLPATLGILRAELDGVAAVASELGVPVPENWPPELYDRDAIEFTIRGLEAAPDQSVWWLYYVVRKGADGAGDVAVGCGGYKGPPSPDGTLEIGYSVLPQHRRRGYATEAAAGLLQHGFERTEVRRVIAETLPELAPSIGVLEKCGFHLTGEGSEPGVIRYEILRQAWEDRSAVAAGIVVER